MHARQVLEYLEVTGDVETLDKVSLSSSYHDLALTNNTIITCPPLAFHLVQ